MMMMVAAAAAAVVILIGPRRAPEDLAKAYSAADFLVR